MLGMYGKKYPRLQVSIGKNSGLEFYAGDLKVITYELPLAAVVGGSVAGGILIIVAIVIVAVWHR